MSAGGRAGRRPWWRRSADQVFVAELFVDAGSVCPAFACTSVETGQRIDTNAAIDGAIGLFNQIEPGRYVLHVTGVIAPPREGIYRGFLDLDPLSMREAGTLGLARARVGALGLATRRQQPEFDKDTTETSI